MKKNIIIIRNAAKSDFGGGERVPVFIAREVLANSILNPIVFSSSQKLLNFAKQESVPYLKTWWWSKQNWSGIQVLLIPFYLIWQIVLFLYYIILFLKLKPIVVHIQSKDDFIAGTLAARTLGIRVLWSDYADLKHIFLNHKIWYKNPIGKLIYLIAHLAEIIIVVSEEDKSLISINIPNGTIKNKLKTFYYGAFDTYKEVDKNKDFTFVSVSRIVTDKGIGELIDAFNKFNKFHSDTKLQIIGDGPERKYFEELAKTNPNIQFLGHKTNPLNYENKAHVFIIPTYHEGFSIALVEACMLKMPIIATKVGGNMEIIFDHKTGLLIPVKDSTALYKAMDLLYSDKNLRQRLAENARKQYKEKFQFDKIVKDRIIPIYIGDKQ